MKTSAHMFIFLIMVFSLLGLAADSNAQCTVQLSPSTVTYGSDSQYQDLEVDVSSQFCQWEVLEESLPSWIIYMKSS